MAPALTPNAQLRWDSIRRWVERIDPASVVEFGAGRGAVGARLAVGRHYRGVEPDATSRAAAEAVMPASGTMTADADGIEPGSIELVCAFEVLEHIDDDVGALTEWAGHLVPGGHLLLSVPAWQERFGAADEWVGHLRRYSPEMLRSAAGAAGLDVLAVEAIGFPLGLVLEAGRNKVAERKTPAGDAAEASAASGRRLQPPTWMGVVTTAGTWPFRQLQKVVHPPKLSTNFVLVARKPL